MAVTVDLGAKANLQAGTDGSYTPKPIGEVTSVSVSLAADPIDITPIAHWCCVSVYDCWQTIGHAHIQPEPRRRQ
jgi:hypothetical protein